MLTTQRRQAKTALAVLSFLLLVTFAQVPVCRAHRGLGVNICARDERPVSAASKRLSCKQDPLCVHETQCGCIPKDCTCGDEHCIFAGPVSGGDADAGKGAGEGERHSHAAGASDHAAAQAVGLGATGSGHGASKHHLVDDDSDGPSHTHADGTAHGHPGGDMPHHHDKDGAIVFDLPKKPAKLVMNKGKLLLKPAAVASKVQAAVAAEDGGDAVDADAVHDRPARAPATGGAAQSGTADAKPESASAAAAGTSAATGARADEGSAPPVNGTGTQDSLPTREIHQKLVGVLVLVLGLGILALMIAACCTCFGSAVIRCFKHKVLGKSMLSKDMFNDKEMMCMDWEAKTNAAAWRHDDGL